MAERIVESMLNRKDWTYGKSNSSTYNVMLNDRIFERVFKIIPLFRMK